MSNFRYITLDRDVPFEDGAKVLGYANTLDRARKLCGPTGGVVMFADQFHATYDVEYDGSVSRRSERNFTVVGAC